MTQAHSFLARWKTRVRNLHREVYVLYLAYRDPRIPWHARAVAVAVAAYAFSPIDLVPDFIPVLGYLDDLVLVPLGIMLALRLIPDDVLAECRTQAQQQLDEGRPVSWVAAAAIIALWALALNWAALVIVRLSKK